MKLIQLDIRRRGVDNPILIYNFFLSKVYHKPITRATRTGQCPQGRMVANNILNVCHYNNIIIDRRPSCVFSPIVLAENVLANVRCSTVCRYSAAGADVTLGHSHSDGRCYRCSYRVPYFSRCLVMIALNSIKRDYPRWPSVENFPFPSTSSSSNVLCTSSSNVFCSSFSSFS